MNNIKSIVRPSGEKFLLQIMGVGMLTNQLLLGGSIQYDD